MRSKPLHNCTALVTRPYRQAMECMALLAQHGGRGLYFPSISIVAQEPLDWGILDATHILVFTSPNCIHALSGPNKSTLKKIIKDMPYVCAVGQGTATALAQVTDGSIIYPLPPYSGESLLALPLFAQIRGKVVGIVTGKNPSVYLPDQLTERGACLRTLSVYERIEETAPLPEDWLHSMNVIISTSCDNLRNLLRRAKKGALFSIPLLVISKKMHALAAALGFQKIIQSPDAMNQTIIQQLMQIHSEKGMT